MVQINSIDINPPLLNSSCVWSSDFAQLQALYQCPFTGAITTRTATLEGYQEDESHIFAFSNTTTSSINSYGYSPHPFSRYLDWTEKLLLNAVVYKPVILSITSAVDDPDSLASMVSQVQELRRKLRDQTDRKARIALELNTSCPNIKNAPPPGYDFKSLSPLLRVLSDAYTEDPTLTIGLKLPPFVHEQQFDAVLDQIAPLNLECALQAPNNIDTPIADGTIVSFLTCTNTLGSSLLFADQSLSPSPPSSSSEARKRLTNLALPAVLGGLAGEALHPLALGNVYRFSQGIRCLEKDRSSISRIKIIGVGGVTSKEAKERMIKAGADVVACATLFGKEGIKAFELLSQP